MLYQAIDESNFEKIPMITASKRSWDVLKNAPRGIDKIIKVHLQVLRGKFYAMSMKNETVSEHFETVLVIDVRVMEKILHSLSPTFEQIAGLVEETKNLEVMKLIDGTLQVHMNKG